MKLTSLSRAFVVCIIATTFYHCSSTKYQLTEASSIQPSHAYYHEWYVGIKVGGSGFNVYLPNLNSQNNVQVDSIYFRRLKGKLVEGRSRYTAVLSRASKHYDALSKNYQEGNKKLNKAVNFPFELKHNECVISYFENGEKKYIKISNLKEKQSIYYEKGAPLAITD
ncbi:MAG: hypothetical protein ACWA5P_01540 [bacterium]